MPEIRFKKESPFAVVPTRATEHAAGFDLTSIGANVIGDRVIVHTGLSVAFPNDYVLLIYGRSGLAFKHGIFLTNGVGVIDADYRGEIMLSFNSVGMLSNHMSALLSRGTRVAQAILTPIPQVDWIEVYDHDDTARGTGGFGSTGA